MNRIISLLFLMSTSVFLLSSCQAPLPDDGKKPDSPDVEGLPVPPEEGNAVNQFYVDFFSTLEDDGDYFSTRDVEVAAGYILEQTGKKSMVYMYDRADFTVGVSYPLNRISYNNAIYQFFAQSEATSSTLIKGTGMATRYPISRYDGIAGNGTYMSGCTIPVPLSTPTQICIYTTTIRNMEQIKEIYSARSDALLADAVIVGTVDNGIKSQVLEYIEDKMSLRPSVYGSSDTAMDLLVVVPPSYVCRGIESGQRINLPYYRVNIEKWM